MAGFADILRAGIATANSVTATLQATVQHYAWISDDGFGTNSYAAAVPRQAIVEEKQRLIRQGDGQYMLSRAKVTFIFPIPANGAAKRQEPIDPRDKIVLPDGTTGPIIDIEGVVDPDTGKPYISEVWLGTTSS